MALQMSSKGIPSHWAIDGLPAVLKIRALLVKVVAAASKGVPFTVMVSLQEELWRYPLGG